jgi:hypothetical protein
MKKLVLTFLSLIIILTSGLGSQAFAKQTDASTTTPAGISQKDFNAIQKALKNTQVKLDLHGTDKVSKQTVYDENGKELGTLGVEEIAAVQDTLPQSDSTGIIQPLTKLSNGYTYTFKVYWYAVSVNYWFYMDVYESSSGVGKVLRVYDQDYFAFGCIISRDVAEIIRQYETASYPAEGRYTITISAPVNSKLWIYGRVKDGEFYTGGN